MTDRKAKAETRILHFVQDEHLPCGQPRLRRKNRPWCFALLRMTSHTNYLNGTLG